MALKIALAGNPNCGKTTVFNALTGSAQYVGNWPGVTVEKKDGRLRGHSDVIIQDLPGIYSLSPYTLEEVVSRNFLLNERPNVVINIVDATNLERNLYLTTQLLELGIPTIIALNMMDVVRKRGDKIDAATLQRLLGCQVVETSAVTSEGLQQLVDKACAAAQQPSQALQAEFSARIEDTLSKIDEILQSNPTVNEPASRRWLAVKVFERDEKIYEQLNFSAEQRQTLDKLIAACEAELDDDSESIITNERYEYIAGIMDKTAKKSQSGGELTLSDKIDKVVTNRILALPIFAAVMF